MTKPKPAPKKAVSKKKSLSIEAVPFRRCPFTSYEESLPSTFKSPVRFVQYQQERCPETDRLHWQGYIEFTKQVLLKQIRDILCDQAVHVKVATGSQQKNLDYTSKDDTAVPGTRVRWGTPAAETQGTRNDIHDYFELAESYTAASIVRMYGTKAGRYINCIRSYQRCLFEPDSVELGMMARELVERSDENQVLAKTMAAHMDTIIKEKRRPGVLNQPIVTIRHERHTIRFD